MLIHPMQINGISLFPGRIQTSQVNSIPTPSVTTTALQSTSSLDINAIFSLMLPMMIVAMMMGMMAKSFR